MSLGIKCKSFVSISSVFTLIDDISDETLNTTKDEAQGDARSSRVKGSEATMLGVDASFKVRTDYTGTVWLFLHDAYWRNDLLTWLFAGHGARAYANGVIDLGNSTAGTKGIRFDGYVFGFGQSRGLGDVLFNDASTKPAVASNFTIANFTGSTISYTAPASL